ncbi:MAG: hypothetical protein LBJ64_01145 [Deltaproteobacteria bacterium]|nr:hypothetical protein [Deltaproteobacteria bacterium]
MATDLRQRFVKAAAQRAAGRHTYRPAKLNRLQVFANDGRIWLAELFLPFSLQLFAPAISIKSDLNNLLNRPVSISVHNNICFF